MLLIDLLGQVWRIHGYSNPIRFASASDEVFAAIRRRRRRVIDVHE